MDRINDKSLIMNFGIRAPPLSLVVEIRRIPPHQILGSASKASFFLKQSSNVDQAKLLSLEYYRYHLSVSLKKSCLHHHFLLLFPQVFFSFFLLVFILSRYCTIRRKRSFRVIKKTRLMLTQLGLEMEEKKKDRGHKDPWCEVCRQNN